MLTNDLFAADDKQNLDAYDDLIVSIQAKEDDFSLLIAVVDDLNFREEIISHYETELQSDFRSYRVTLARGEPSLRGAISQLVENEEYLRQGGKAVITVTGVEQLYFLKMGEERSEQEIFFGYLQWTREALREFPYPIILWVTNQILSNLIKKAPDFWSWRTGVFHFVSRKKITVYSKDIEPIRSFLSESLSSGVDDDNPYFLPIEDLKQFIKQKEQEGVRDSNLATLYFSLGDIYRKRLENGEFQDYKTEQDLAIEYFSKAVELQKELGLEKDLASSLNNLAFIYKSQGRYSEAEPLFIQALELNKQLGGESHPDVADSLNALGLLYTNQGRYTEAENLYIKSLEMTKSLRGESHHDVSIALNNLAELYRIQGRYGEAEPLYLQSLDLKKSVQGQLNLDVAITLNNLALLYFYQRRYEDAERFALQAIKIDKQLLGKEHPAVATALHNLALIYRGQRRYQEAEDLFIKVLELKERLLPKNHPELVDTIYALGYMYKIQGRYSEAEPLCVKALELDKLLWGNNHLNVAQSITNLAELYDSQGRYTEAESLYIQAFNIYKQSLGMNHSHTTTVRENLETLRAEMQTK